MRKNMKKFVLSIGMAAMLAAALPLIAQSPDLHHIYAYTPIQVASVQHYNTPTGILPAE